MKKVVALSFTMIAFSGGAGLGLSLLHGHTMPTGTAHLAQPAPMTDAQTGFAIPEFVPVSAPAALPQPSAPARAALPKVDVSQFVSLRPQMRPEILTTRTASLNEEVTFSPSRAVPDGSELRATPRPAPQRFAPAQPQANFAFVPDVQVAPSDDWVIGVYR